MAVALIYSKAVRLDLMHGIDLFPGDQHASMLVMPSLLMRMTISRSNQTVRFDCVLSTKPVSSSLS